jgi:hypothetical protein
MGGNQFPSAVLAPVIDKKEASCGDFAACFEAVHDGSELADGFRQYFFFVVTGDDDAKVCVFHTLLT